MWGTVSEAERNLATVIMTGGLLSSSARSPSHNTSIGELCNSQVEFLIRCTIACPLYWAFLATKDGKLDDDNLLRICVPV